MLPTIATGNVGSALAGEYEVANSLRFDDGSSDYLSRSYSSAGNRKTFTVSFWVKRSLNGASQRIFGNYTSANLGVVGNFNSNDTFQFYNRNTTTGDKYAVTNRVFRDPSAWYHFVITVDTTDSTSSDRLKYFINGVRETSFSEAYEPPLDYVYELNSNVTHYIGQRGNNTQYFDGYLAEFVIIDGQALDPTSFGEFDSNTNIWKPKDVSGLTFGTNGFYLDFENSGSLGADVSGNGNNFTVNNLTSIDQSTDTCTNNFATGNPLLVQSLTFSNGNLSISAGADWESSVSTIAVNKGKWYAEFKFESGSYCMFGVTDIDDAMKVGDAYSGVSGSLYSIGHDQTNSYYTNGSTIANGSTFTTGDIISIALDMDNGKVHFAKNGTYELSSVPASNTGGLTLPSTNYYQFSHGNYSSSSSANFGNPPYSISSGNSDANGYGNFEYSVPSGYYALNTKNLAEYG